MRTSVTFGLAIVLSACGEEAEPRASSTAVEETTEHVDPEQTRGARPTRVEGPPTPATTEERHEPGSAEADVDELDPTGLRRELLAGRVSFEAPASLRLRPREVFDRPREREHYDAYSTRFEECALELAIVSAGLVRPTGELLPLPEGGARVVSTDPRSGARLEGMTIPHRRIETLGVAYDGPGAVVFEPDATAIDLYVWARAAEAEDGGYEEDRWRTSPAALACLEPARHLRDLVLSTLSVARPYASDDVVHFGYEESARADGWIPYRGVLPAGWTVSSGVAFDAAFAYVHRRLPWTESGSREPSPAAKIWAFTDSPIEVDMIPAGATRRATLFGRTLIFDANGCAQELVPDIGHVQYVCLTGTAAEQAEILDVLATFVPVDGREHPPPAIAPCMGAVFDDTPLRVRARPSPGGAVVGELPDRTQVRLVARSGSWARIDSPLEGWVHGGHVTTSACAADLPAATGARERE